MKELITGGVKDLRFVFRVNGSPADVEAVISGNGKTVITDTSTVALPGDIVRFETGAYAFREYPVLASSTNSFTIPQLTPEPAVADTFYILRFTSQRVDDSGAQTVVVSPSPIAYEEDSIDTTVSIDTSDATVNKPLPIRSVGSYINSIRLDYSVTNVLNSAWVQLSADIGAEPVNAITLFDGGGYAMELGIGAASSEVRTLLIPPGGFNGVIPLFIPANSRLSIKAVGAATVNAGEIDINLMR